MSLDPVRKAIDDTRKDFGLSSLGDHQNLREDLPWEDVESQAYLMGWYWAMLGRELKNGDTPDMYSEYPEQVAMGFNDCKG